MFADLKRRWNEKKTRPSINDAPWYGDLVAAFLFRAFDRVQRSLEESERARRQR